MAKSSALYVRMDSELKERAEEILNQLGVSSSSVVQMLYKQIILHRGIPFDVKLPDTQPVSIGGLSRAQVDAELQKGMESLEKEPTYSVDEVDQELAREFGI